VRISLAFRIKSGFRFTCCSGIKQDGE